MSKTGTHIVKIKGRTFIIEPINEFPERNADWTNGGIDRIKGGAIKPEDSQITEEQHVITLPPGVSPYSFIEKYIEG